MELQSDADNHRISDPFFGTHRTSVAVDCWYTVSGRVIPRFLKYQDEDGLIHTLTDIQLIKAGAKHPRKLISQHYVCKAVLNGREQEFLLIFHPGTDTWDMILP